MLFKDLNIFIHHYITEDKTNSALMLTGPWGSGKTYYINNVLKPYLKAESINCYTISLYGLNNVLDISKYLFNEIYFNKLEEHSSFTIGKIIAKSLLKTGMNMARIQLDMSEEDKQKIYNSIDFTNKLIIFEDLERCEIPIRLLMGFINNLVEQDNVKVLLVTNESEISLSKDNKAYSISKEKTVNDTIHFSPDYKTAIAQILSNFNFDIAFLNHSDNLIQIINDIYAGNLRTFIYAIQKLKNLFLLMDNLDIDSDFKTSVFYSTLYFVGIIKKSDEFPKWEGNQYYSISLSQNKQYPVYKFTYNFIKNQTIVSTNDIESAYAAYKIYLAQYVNIWINDKDLQSLDQYYLLTEKEVKMALTSLNNKLNYDTTYNISIYPKLIYKIVSASTAIQYNPSNIITLLLKKVEIENEYDIQEIKRQKSMYSNDYFEDEKDKIEFEKILEKLEKKAYEIILNKNQISYDHTKINQLYYEICLTPQKYIINNSFISRYEIDKLILMLRESSASELNDFRGILLALYRDGKINNYSKNDKDFLLILKKRIHLEQQQNNTWDKIQKLQIGYMINNIDSVIK